MLISADTFIRIEDKFIMPRSLLDRFERLVSQNLQPCYPDPGTRFTRIESIYFDSEMLDFFRDHFMQDGRRYKMRFRMYCPNGGEDPRHLGFLEVKIKENEVSKKSRLALSAQLARKLSRFSSIKVNNELFQLNASMDREKLLRRVELVNELVARFQVVPQLRISYCRRAYECGDLRVTIDSDIGFERVGPPLPETAHAVEKMSFWSSALEMMGRYSVQDNIVVEVKHRGLIPEWGRDFMKNENISATSFSKYCWSMTTYLSELSKFSIAS